MTFTQKSSIFLALAFVAYVFATNSQLAAEKDYGHLRGRLLYDGEPPAPKPIEIVGFDRDKLDSVKLFDESLVVDLKSHGLANVVIFLHLPKDEAPPEMHPSYRIAPDTPDDNRTRTMSMIDTRYVPRVLLVRTDEIYLSVSDTVRGYNPKLDFTANHNSCALQPPGATQTHEFRQPERAPVKISDAIYPWMHGWVMIQDHPYMAVTDADGRFEIRNIPTGRRTFRFWHEKGGFVSRATIDKRKVAWEKGLVTFEIRADEAIDLGEVKVAPSSFE